LHVLSNLAFGAIAFASFNPWMSKAPRIMPKNVYPTKPSCNVNGQHFLVAKLPINNLLVVRSPSNNPL